MKTIKKVLASPVVFALGYLLAIAAVVVLAPTIAAVINDLAPFGWSCVR